MKKVFLSIVAIMAVGVMNAQDIKFGVKGGLNVATMTGGEGSAGTKVGFHVGGLVEIPLAEKFAIQPELLYSLKGSSFDGFGGDFGGFDFGTPAYDVNLSYIDIPVMFKYYVIEGLSIEAGPQVGFLMSAKGLKYNEDNDTYDDKGDIKDEYKSIDVAFNIGAGYKLTNGLMFQLRYSIGLTDISEDPEVDPNDFFGGAFVPDYSVKNNVFQASIGYQF